MFIFEFTERFIYKKLIPSLLYIKLQASIHYNKPTLVILKKTLKYRHVYFVGLWTEFEVSKEKKN